MLYPTTYLLRYRRLAGLTQRQVAAALALQDRGSVGRWERGDRLPTPARLLELSVLYSRLVNDLLWPQYLEAQHRIHERLRDLDLRPE